MMGRVAQRNSASAVKLGEQTNEKGANVYKAEVAKRSKHTADEDDDSWGVGMMGTLLPEEEEDDTAQRQTCKKKPAMVVNTLNKLKPQKAPATSAPSASPRTKGKCPAPW